MLGIDRAAAEASAAEIFEGEGVKVAFIRASQVYEKTTTYFAAGPGTPASALPRNRTLQVVRDARADAYLVVAYMDLGLEELTCPGNEAIVSARDLETAGADVVLGDHDSASNCAGCVGDAYVPFGLGNLVY